MSDSHIQIEADLLREQLQQDQKTIKEATELLNKLGADSNGAEGHGKRGELTLAQRIVHLNDGLKRKLKVRYDDLVTRSSDPKFTQDKSYLEGCLSELASILDLIGEKDG